MNIRNVLGDSALSAAANGTCRKVDQEAVKRNLPNYCFDQRQKSIGLTRKTSMLCAVILKSAKL